MVVSSNHIDLRLPDPPYFLPLPERSPAASLTAALVSPSGCLSVQEHGDQAAVMYAHPCFASAQITVLTAAA
jgi:hypothetical protein